MKSKKLAIIFGASLLAMPVTGCNHFGSFLPPELESLEITATENKSFVKGEHFFDCADIEVSGYYTNGKEREFSISEVEIFYTNDETGEEYSIGTAIPEAGEYTVQARYNNIISDCYCFTAVESHVYATSFEWDLEEEDRQITLAPGDARIINFGITPSNYTEQLEFYSSDTSIAHIVKIDATRYEVVAEAEGTARIGFGAITSPKLTKDLLDLTVIVMPIFVKRIDLTNVPDELETRSGKYFTIDVYPQNANVAIEVFASNDSVSIRPTEEDSRKFYCFCNHTGSVILIFKAKSGFGTYCTAMKKMVITEAYFDSISVDPSFAVGLNCDRNICVYYEPYDGYVSVVPEVVNYDKDIIDVKYYGESRDHFEFTIHGKKKGETNLSFKAQIGKYTYVPAWTLVKVTDVWAESFTVSGPNVVNVDSTITINADVQPEEYAFDVWASVENSNIVSIWNTSSTSFKVKGKRTGTTTITFYAKEGAFNLKQEFKITVVDKIRKTPIRQHFVDATFRCATPYKSTKRDPVKMLIIPIWFEDSFSYIGKKSENSFIGQLWNNADKSYVYNAIEEVFFGTDESLMSVQQYYTILSNGKFKTEKHFTDWFEDKYNYTYYDSEKKREDLIKRATNDYFKKHKTESRQDYDIDGDGFIDCIGFVYAGPSGARGNAMYNYRVRFTDKSPNKKNPVVNSCIFMSYDRITGGISNPAINYRTAIHEMGHMFGPIDYYDEKGAIVWSGGHTMQASSSGSLDPFSVMAIGWANPYVVTDTAVLTINDFQSSHDLIVITPEWNDKNSPFDEYMILELYSPTMLNEELSSNLGDVGIRVWHVDSRFKDGNNNFTSDAKKADKFAFNNDHKTDKDTTSSDNVAHLQTIRQDAYKSTDGAITYLDTTSITSNNLFKAGDGFNFHDYRNQFWNYYSHKEEYIKKLGHEPANDDEIDAMENALKKYLTLNNGKEFRFVFDVDNIVDNKDGTYSATISIWRY